MRTHLTLLLVVLPILIWAQDWQWSRHIGGPGPDGAYIGGVDTDGSVLLYGSYAQTLGPNTLSGLYFAGDTLTGGSDAFIAKYSATGGLEWARSIECAPGSAYIGGLAIDTIAAVFYTITTYVGACVLDTCFVSAFDAGIVLAKWNADGHCLWARNIATSGSSALGSAAGFAVALDGDGDLIVSMKTDRYGTTIAGTQPMVSGSFLGKYDSDGEQIWVKPFASYAESEKWVTLYTLKRSGDRIIGHGPAVIQEADDTTVVDTISIVGRQGQGYALVSIDPETGIAEWFRLDAFPAGESATESMDVDANGHVFCTGMYLPSAVFDTDTLASVNPWANGFLVKYAPDGSLLFVDSLVGSDGFGPSALDVTLSGNVAVAGTFRGQIELNGNTYSAAGNFDLFVSFHSSSGESVGFGQATGGQGSSVEATSTGVFVAGRFAVSVPFGSMSIGGETYTSHGWEDIVLAKHDLITSVPSSMALDDSGLLIFANPNQGSFQLQVPNALVHERELVLRIFDSTGRLVREQQLNMTEERPRLDVFDVATGLYNVMVTNGKRTYSGSMVVE